MRLFGHKDATIAFIPFLGAATTTSKPFARRWQEVAMLLFAALIPANDLAFFYGVNVPTLAIPRMTIAGS